MFPQLDDCTASFLLSLAHTFVIRMLMNVILRWNFILWYRLTSEGLIRIGACVTLLSEKKQY
jgi:uncharacterized protein (DUF983 family)